MSLLELYCAVDTFYASFLPRWQQSRLTATHRSRNRLGTLHPSEIMTILIHFHQTRHRDFTPYDTQYVRLCCSDVGRYNDQYETGDSTGDEVHSMRKRADTQRWTDPTRRTTMALH